MKKLPFCLVCAFWAMGLFGSVPLDWNVALLEAVRAESTSPNTAVRNFAILHAAIHDGVNVVEGKYKAYTEHGGKCPDLDAGAVATGAAFRVAGVLYPSRMPVFEKVLGEFRDGFAGDKELLSKSLERGYGVADVILKLREDDGASTQVTYVPVEEVGKWRRTPNRFRPPEQPHWRYVRPFCIPSVEPFLPPPPPALVSKEYAEALEEVRKIGGKDSRFRTEEQSGIAKFWADFSYTESPPGHWNHIAGDIVRLENLPLVEAARLYALLNLSMADAGIVAWEAKYRYHFWRPVHSIRGAEKDGNPATRPDRKWEPLLESPPHPEYVSGHSTYSAAGARALELFMGKDHYDFVTHSDTLKGVSRKFLSFSACAEECGRSRIYGGIHYKFSNANGLVAGSRVAAFIFNTACQPASK